jgi:hypothetical protein
MTSPTALTNCTGQSTTATLQRVNFFNRQLLTADDMTTDRDYFIAKLRRHNRFLHGTGVVCGLVVKAAPVTGTPWRVAVSSGYALGPYGDEIFVGEPVYFDLSACASSGMTSPCEPSVIVSGAAGTSSTVYLAIQYAECLARPVQVASSGCGCDSDPCQYSRIRDSFQIQCLATLPAQPALPTVTLCQVIQNPVLSPCPPCPTNGWVVLAKITLPGSSSMNIADSAIDNVSVRRVLVSSALLQAQVVSCCCGQTTTATGNLSIAQTYAPFNTNPTYASLAQQISVAVTNNSTFAATNVVVTVNLSATGNAPAAPQYYVTLTAGEWTTAAGANLAQLVSTPIASLAAGQTQTLTYQVTPEVGVAVLTFTLTSAASAVTSTSGITGASNTITVPFGGTGNVTTH